MKKIIICTRVNDNIKFHLEADLRTQCPHCNTLIEPLILSSVSYTNKIENTEDDLFFEYDTVLVTTLCQSCNNPIIYMYDCYDQCEMNYKNAVLERVMPQSQFKKEFSTHIKNLSPNFIKIYNQAYLSEQLGFDEICGIGYRKSLEFLLKDFAIKHNSEDAEKIKNIPLSKCISTYIDSPRIKTLATASAWLGNDETHYIRKHEDYRIEHLKMFIDCTVAFIDEEETLNLATEMIQNNK